MWWMHLQILYRVKSEKVKEKKKEVRKSEVQSAKTRPEADCGSDHEFPIAKFALKLKNVGKTTRPSRYDLSQIPYDYTLHVRNRFKGLDLIDRVPEEL